MRSLGALGEQDVKEELMNSFLLCAQRTAHINRVFQSLDLSCWHHLTFLGDISKESIDVHLL